MNAKEIDVFGVENPRMLVLTLSQMGVKALRTLRVSRFCETVDVKQYMPLLGALDTLTNGHPGTYVGVY